MENVCLHVINLPFNIHPLIIPEILSDNDLLPDDPPEEEEEELEPTDDYLTLRQALRDKWMLIEITHQVSKEASNAFWKTADAEFHKLYQAKTLQGITRKVPQFAHLRKELYKSLPPITLELGYLDRKTGKIKSIEVQSAPTSKFKHSEYKKLYEIATIRVSLPIFAFSCMTIILL